MAATKPTLFEVLGAELPALAAEGNVRPFAAGQVVFSAGDPGDGFYVVTEGRVRITAVVGQNEPRVLAMIGPGDFFGEMAVVDDAPRSATATADVATRALFLGRDQMLGLLEGRPHLALSLLRAFSDRMRMLNQKYVDEMLQAERMAVVGRFAGGIVHDFKSPLTIIGMSAELAAQDETTPERRRSAQATIARQVDRMNNMLHDLIAFAKPGARVANLQPVGFAGFAGPLLREIRDEVAPRRVDLRTQEPIPDVPVRIDAPRLSRLFHNLVNNAVDAMAPAGGQVFVTFTLLPKALQVDIRDTGKGIPPEIAGSLFQPFATHGKKHGTGLGLSICKQIAEDHGGKIWVTSAPGQGATFSFTLPRS